MSIVERFELRRQVDDLVYRFRRQIGQDGRPAYKREDRDLWIVRSEQWGWISVLPEDGAISGRPWEVLPQNQGDSPPEGVWVSRKGDKSYVYDLVHI
ncbi:MAG: hypothetical protein KKH72_01190 [Alphaproteobacteria bacterium]|nr:hypothetical protein [Alphaproteobacteria bacterium]